MEYSQNHYPNDQEQQMHSILEEGFNNMRRSYDRSSNAGRSVSSSKPSPATRKKSQLRRVLDELKSNHSSIGTYSEDIGYKYNDHTMQSVQYSNIMPDRSGSGMPEESPMKTTHVEKYTEMQNELAMLQQRIEGLNDKLTYNPTESSKYYYFLISTP
jgi:hypothetical protein